MGTVGIPVLFVLVALLAGLVASSTGSPVVGGLTPQSSTVPLAGHPSGGHLSVTVHNVMANATGVYEQPIWIDSAALSQWVNSNWTNGQVDDAATSTPLNAWIESGASNTTNHTLLWVRMPSIPAGAWSNLTIVFGAKTSFDLSVNGSMGEAPELSATYGEFDNGARVFNFYANFSGSSLTASWTVNGGWNYTVHDGFTWNATPGNGDGIVTTRNFTYPAVVDAYSNLYESNPTGVYTGQGFGSGGCMICSPSNSSAVGWEAQTSNASGPAPWAARNATHENGTSVFSTQRDAVFTTEAINRSVAHFLVNYHGLQTLTEGIPSDPVPIILAQTGLPAGNLTNSTTTTWIRERTFEAQMPTVRVGGIPASPVTFVATGLPWGTSWTVDLGSSSSTATGPISFLEPNGSFSYSIGSIPGFVAHPASGSVNVTGSAQTITIRFASSSGGTTHYVVDFTESGLTSGSTWQITLNGTSKNGTSSTIGFTEPNGSYRYTAGCGSNDTATPSSGYANVSGSILAISVVCQNATGGFLSLVFEAANLPQNLSWSVTLFPESTGLILASTPSVTRAADGGASIRFQATTGTYAYLASASGYPDENGTVTISGAVNQVVSVRFSSGLSVSPPLLSSGPARTTTLTIWTVGLGVFLIGSLGIATTLLRGRSLHRERGRRYVRDLAEIEWTADDSGEPIPRLPE